MLRRRKFFFERQPIYSTIDVHIGEQHDNVWSIAKPIEFELQQGITRSDPCITLNYEECQGLMDELWTIGLRPTEGTGSAGALKATQNHLDDMRKIVFKMLKMT